MPELPEVETIRMGLQKYLVGKTVTDVEIRLAKQLTGDKNAIIGATITGVRRFGKGLVIDLSNGYSIAIHVKMTGQLIYRGAEIPMETPAHPVKVGKIPGPYTHVIFHLRDKNKKDAFLFYNDIRQFGWIILLKTDEVERMPFFKDLGPEPFKDLDLKTFQTILSKNKTAIKSLLLDQKKMAGIGNIYANDALFLAKINPKRPAQSLSSEETMRLFDSLLTVLKKGLQVGGASEWQYVNVLGQTGGYQNFLQVYGQEGKPCQRCGTKIVRINLGGRGTFFCPKCQI